MVLWPLFGNGLVLLSYGCATDSDLMQQHQDTFPVLLLDHNKMSVSVSDILPRCCFVFCFCHSLVRKKNCDYTRTNFLLRYSCVGFLFRVIRLFSAVLMFFPNATTNPALYHVQDSVSMCVGVGGEGGRWREE